MGPLPPKLLPLEISKRDVGDRSESESELKAHITTIVTADQLANGADIPHLGHAHDGTHNAEAEGSESSNAGWEFLGLVVDLRSVAAEAALVDEVFGQRNAFVDGQPVADAQHEVLQHRFEVAVAWDGDGAVDDRGDQGPNEAGHVLSIVRDGLERERDGVDVGAVVADDGEGEHHNAECAEVAEPGDENFMEEPSNVVVVVSVGVGWVVDCCGADGCAQHHAEAQWDKKSKECVRKDLDSADVHRLINTVVRGVGPPASSEAENRCSEGED